jgi:hypothetical protein
LYALVRRSSISSIISSSTTGNKQSHVCEWQQRVKCGVSWCWAAGVRHAVCVFRLV